MYAQLCKRLSEEAPNFDTPPNPCTFRILLLNKCRTEFENRSKANEAFENSQELSPEDAERKLLAKRKMLGNIKVGLESRRNLRNVGAKSSSLCWGRGRVSGRPRFAA